MIELCGLSAGYGGLPVLKTISVSIQPGKILALLGPNGSGKSTLLRIAAGLQKQTAGTVLLDGIPMMEVSPRQRAQRVAFLAQSRNTPNVTAERMVLHGRFPYLSFPRRYRPEDISIAQGALERMGAEAFSRRFLTELSGGQRQKVYLAMALAQNTETILMDEPLTFLDVAHQLETLRLARELAESGKAVVLVLHDIGLALRHADQVLLLSRGEALFLGTPEEAFLSGKLEEAFGIAPRRVAADGGWQYYFV